MAQVIYNKKAIAYRRLNFVRGEAYAYPVIASYIRHRLATTKKYKSLRKFIVALNEKYNTKYWHTFLRDFERDNWAKDVTLGHINMFTSMFDEDIYHFCKFYAEYGKPLNSPESSQVSDTV